MLKTLFLCLLNLSTASLQDSLFKDNGAKVPSFDSLNITFIGSWPFGHPRTLVLDTSRQLAFCSAGGGVYIIDITDPSNPQILSNQIRTRGFVRELYYEQNDHLLFVADGQAGLEIWDIYDPYDPGFVGSVLIFTMLIVFL